MIESSIIIGMIPHNYDGNYMGNNNEAYSLMNKLQKIAKSSERKLNISLGDGMTRPCHDGKKHDFKMVELKVSNNTNYYTQLKVLPMLLIPDFLTLSKARIEKERMKLVSNYAWAMTNFIKLAKLINGLVMVAEESDYSPKCIFAIRAIDGMTPEVEDYVGKIPHYASIFKNQVVAVKASAKAVKLNYSEVTINKESYWGLFDLV